MTIEMGEQTHQMLKEQVRNMAICFGAVAVTKILVRDSSHTVNTLIRETVYARKWRANS